MVEALVTILENDKEAPEARAIALSIDSLLSLKQVADTIVLSDAYYILGHYHLNNNMYNRASDHFSVSVAYREKIGLKDRRYALGLTNRAVALLRAGDYSQAYEQGVRGLEARRAVSGGDSSVLASNYLNLASICLEMYDTDKAVRLAESGLYLTKVYPGIITPKVKADLYQVIGLSLYRTSEYTKSLVYCREALRLYETDDAASLESKLLILNTISQLYRRLNQPSEAETYFRKGLALNAGGNIRDKFIIYINYADFLTESGRASEGEKVLNDGISNVRREYGLNSREYCMVMASAGDFVNRTSRDSGRALEIYGECFTYIETHPWDVSMDKYILVKYAEILLDAEMYERVLEVTDGLPQNFPAAEAGATNSGQEITFSEYDLELLLLRYRALNALARKNGTTDRLMKAVATGRILVSLYDRQRLEMSEEESRTGLSAFSREIYTGMIENYTDLYERTHERESLEGLFEFSERSKVAGFLASMRELNAARFSLPSGLTGLDNEIRQKIGLYRELIESERTRTLPDTQRIATWESVTFRLLRSRDSLVRIFEESYPSYYNLKFRNEVTPLKDVTRVIGKKSNLLSYVLTEDKLFIFVTNSRNTEIITRDIDSTFFTSLHRFRSMLSTYPVTTVVRQPFNDYMDLAYELYRILLEPAVPFLKGDKVIISPDNILSYLPFETLVTEEFRSPELLYREAPFALKKYRFSYIYSVTLSSETQERSRSLRNTLVAFAPSYDGMVLEDSLLVSWPNLRGEIRSLPFAALESEDAVEQCGGEAYLADEATEEAYKREAGKYDIIHLAMHTLINDRDPAYSKMIFSDSGDGTDDGMLNTYEVYSVPVNAMMVVLSSCNTGVGKLVSGEGILSLARGFLYAGSRSVVMSMWAVEDNSASQVVGSFYKNMRSGQTKSTALRSARLKFLRTASQGGSHPYFWSSMVIFGDDTPLWFNRVRLYSGLLILLMTVAVLVASVYKGPKS
jgi:CHAT domain-containing protein/tetratricopeptide (TPR) repeat protein